VGAGESGGGSGVGAMYTQKARLETLGHVLNSRTRVKGMGGRGG